MTSLSVRDIAALSEGQKTQDEPIIKDPWGNARRITQKPRPDGGDGQKCLSLGHPLDIDARFPFHVKWRHCRREGTLGGIDVFIPCYNYGRFLRQCVNSVLGQAGV